ncbi:MAG: flavodoxin domain-containing protein [Bacteroidales bacterium]|nr:flavodoxin domain-containing protein [Bacteroidales bacterium]
MKNILITYQSRTGITKKYAEEIAAYLKTKIPGTTVLSVKECNNELISKADLILLGCWTNGLMIFLQHPDKVWKNFAKGLPSVKDKKVGLFATYKLATGSMFKKMKVHLSAKTSDIAVELKSKRGNLSDNDKSLLDQIID